MTASAILLALAVMLSADLVGAAGKSVEKANIPDTMQMHTDSIDEVQITSYKISLYIPAYIINISFLHFSFRINIWGGVRAMLIGGIISPESEFQ